MDNRWILLVVFFCILQGCGEGSSSFNAPTLTFLSSNIDQYPETVPHTIKQIEIQVKEDLKITTVNTQTVHLMAGESSLHNHAQLDLTGDDSTAEPFQGTDLTGAMDTIEGNAWFDPATRKIYFAPLKPLAEGTTYHIRIHNVELSDGRKVEVIPRTDGKETGVIQFSFTTTHSHEITRVRYDSSGNETAYVTFRVENNRLKERRQYKNKTALPSSILFDEPLPAPSNRIATMLSKNDEGVITSYDYDEKTGDVTASVRITKPGQDNLWGTDDDLAVSWTEHSQLHTTHEVIKNYTVPNLSEPIVWQGLNSSGFNLRSVYLIEHAGTSFEHRDVFYNSLGGNGVVDMDPVTNELLVGDDTITLWHKRDYVNGKRIRSWSIGGVGEGEGADRQLFTDDDVANGLSTLDYYPNDGSVLAGQLKELVTYYKFDFEQPLNSWLVDPALNIVRADAPVHSYRVYLYDNQGNRSEEIQYSPGADKVKGTADDYVTQKVTYSTSPTVDGRSLLGLN